VSPYRESCKSFMFKNKSIS